MAAVIFRIYAFEAEAVGAVQRRKIKARRESSRLAEHDVACAGGSVRAGCADNDVVEAIAVDVARVGNRRAVVVAGIDAGKAKTVAPVERF